jgi:mRNA interferase MazF
MTRPVIKPGDIVWVDFNPRVGHEQSGRRPALVISHAEYNKKTGLAICCPITSKQKHHLFEVAFDASGISGVILVDQLKSLDLVARKAKKAAVVDNRTLLEVRSRVKALLEL